MDENEYPSLDFPCFHDAETLCRKCHSRMLWMRQRAIPLREADRDFYWREELVAQFRLIQDQVMKRIVRESKEPESPPLTPFPPCDLCGDPGDIVLPDTRTFCGDCWRKHVEFQKSQRLTEK